MGTIKGQRNKAYILLESLVALAIFSMITSLLLAGVTSGRRWQKGQWQRQEMLLLVKMAVQTKQERLVLNGVHVRIERDEHFIRVWSQDEEVMYIEKE